MFVKFYCQFNKEQGDESSYMFRDLLCFVELKFIHFYTFITAEKGKVM